MQFLPCQIVEWGQPTYNKAESTDLPLKKKIAVLMGYTKKSQE